MEVGSVASSLNSATISPANSQSRQFQQAQQVVQAQQSQQQAQPSQAVDEGEAANRAREQVEASRPTVNANGQTVGVRVNTTA